MGIMGMPYTYEEAEGELTKFFNAWNKEIKRLRELFKNLSGGTDMGIDNLLFICPLLRHLAGKPNEGISVENFEHLVDGDFEIDGEFMPWDINSGDTGGTDMVNWKEKITDWIEDNHRSICLSTETCLGCLFRNSEGDCLLGSEEYYYREPAGKMILLHLVAPGVVTNWQDDAEIRERIAEMLDEETRRKFLGKPKPKIARYYGFDAEQHLIYRTEANPHIPEFRYLIMLGRAGSPNAAFRDEDTRDRVLEFLNGEAE